MPQFQTPPKPTLALRLGVTGHRGGERLPAGEVPRLLTVTSALLARIARAAEAALGAQAAFHADGGPRLALVSALAEGADRIAAEAAVAAGWRLDVVLPLSPQEYRKDFATEASREAFDRLVARAASVFDLAMPGDDPVRPAAYEQAGRLMLDNCDLMLAIWDGKPARGQGGSGQMVAEALERGIAVLHIDPLGLGPPRLLSAGRPPQPLDRELDGLIMRLTAPPPDTRALTRFLEEGAAHGARRDGRLLSWWRFAPGFAAFARLFGRHPRRNANDSLSEPVPGTGDVSLTARYETADAISTHLGHVYRSAFMLAFLASAAAVLAGLFGVFWWEDTVAKATLVGVELLFVALVLAMTVTGRRREWHRRWLETRRLAELLRVQAALQPSGGGAAHTPDGQGENDETDDGAWTVWYARASLREAPLPTLTCDRAGLSGLADRFVTGLLDPQIAYHHGNEHRLHALHHGLDRLGLALFWTTFAIGVAFLGLVFAAKVLHVFDLDSGAFGAMFKDWIKPAVTLCSAGLPALGAALYGIRAQGDYEASAARSAATARQLAALRTRILAERAAPDVARLRSLFDEAAEIMQSDLSDWRQLYRHRPIVIPA